MNYSIRKLKINESKDYRKLRLESLKIYPDYFASKYNEQLKLAKLYFERNIENEDSKKVMFGAFFNDKLIGICGLILENETGEIVQMYIQKEHQGNRLAQHIVAHICKQIVLNSLKLEVHLTNTTAINSYLHSGFKAIKNSTKPEKFQTMILPL